MTTLPFRLDRELTILASRETVFRYFTDRARWERWWGAGSSVEARPGGRMVIRYPDGSEATGEVLEVHPPERIVFTYGYSSGTMLVPGASRVTIRLESSGRATRLYFTHEVPDAATRDAHVDGWRYHMAVLSNAVSDEVNAAVVDVVDAWFRVWSSDDATTRHAMLASIASDDVRFRDRFGATEGLAELAAHISNAQRFMPGFRVERRGDVRHTQGSALFDWVTLSGDGHPAGGGSNVFTLGPDGRIEAVIGFWSAIPGSGAANG
jgi:uncharacterized protein YndB with AHSA1/START domain